MSYKQRNRTLFSVLGVLALTVTLLFLTLPYALADTQAPSQRDIIGGRDANPGEVPFQGDMWSCGGTLIYPGDLHSTPQIPAVFVTDAHCLTSKSPLIGGGYVCTFDTNRVVFFTVGSTSRNTHEGTEQRVRSRKIIILDGYLPNCDPNFDLALVFTDPVGVNDVVKSIRPLTPEDAYAVRVGASVTFAGYGLVSVTPTIIPDKLQIITLPITACNNWYPQANFLCTGTLNQEPIRDFCFGDSGSSGFIFYNNEFRLVGPPAYGLYCTGYSASMNLSTPHLFNWIKDTIIAEMGVNIYTPTPTPLPNATATPTFTPTPTPAPDFDQDGVSDLGEDVNKDGNVENDDTDADQVANYRDWDDDGDNLPTSYEAFHTFGNNQYNTDNYPDADYDGVPNYLEVDDDDDNVSTICEVDSLGNHQRNPHERDRDAISDHVDPDDDNDGIPTQNELGPGYTGDCASIPDANGNGIKAHLDPDEAGTLATPVPTSTPTPTSTPVVGISAHWEKPHVLVKASAQFSNTVFITNTELVTDAVKTVAFSIRSMPGARPVAYPIDWSVDADNTLKATVLITDTQQYSFSWVGNSNYRHQSIAICWNGRRDCEEFAELEDQTFLFLPLIRKWR